MEPVSPRGRLFLQQEVEHVIHSIIYFEHPIEIPPLITSLSSAIRACSRMRSLVVKDPSGREHWEELPLSKIDVSAHVIVLPEEERESSLQEEERETLINDYVASLVSCGSLRRDIPLWDVHVFPEQRRTLVIRLHHALGDCLSLTALLLATLDTGGSVGDERESKTRERFSSSLWRVLKAAWYTLPTFPGYPLFAARLKEDKTMIKGGAKMEFLPRKLGSVALCLEDMRIVKNKLDAKINDVFIGIIACGIAKYLRIKSGDDASKHAPMTALSIVNIRGKGLKDMVRSLQRGENLEWGNEFGYFMHGIDLNDGTGDPLIYVWRAKETIDRKKMSLEAQSTHKGTSLLMSLFGPTASVLATCNILSNISLLLSNINGPSHALALGNNQITKIGLTASGLPVPIDVRILSYNGKAFVQVLVAAKLIPDPKVLCRCIKEALLEMKASAIEG